MPLATRLSSKFNICPRANVYLSAVGIVLQYTSHRERFIYWIIHAFAFSLPFPSYFRCLHPLMRLCLFQKKTNKQTKQQQQQRQKKKKKTCFATYRYLHVCRSLVLRLKSTDFIESCSKWICLLLSRRLNYLIMLCEMNVQWKLFPTEYESTLIFDRSKGLNSTLRQY